MVCRVVGRISFFLSGVSVICMTLGCGGSDIEGPDLSADDASDQAIAQFDTNKDGKLNATELSSSPGLKASLEMADKDKDGFLSADEVTARLASYAEGGLVIMPFSVQIRIDGRPLPEAEVTLVPESILGPGYKSAKSTTSDIGVASFRMDGSEFDGVYAGIYRIEVSKKSPQGRELLPDRYNTKTTLGQEVAIDVSGIDHAVVINLTSKQ